MESWKAKYIANSNCKLLEGEDQREKKRESEYELLRHLSEKNSL